MLNFATCNIPGYVFLFTPMFLFPPFYGLNPALAALKSSTVLVGVFILFESRVGWSAVTVVK